MKTRKFFLCFCIICISSMHAFAQTDSTIVQTGIRIVPNPVTSMFQIEGLDPSVKTQIIVSASYGKVIFQNRVSGVNKYSVNAEKLKPGLYYVTIKEGESNIVLRFLKE